ncbi:hypothetical protein BDV93DRAFT_512432 [Ceratobasidium sp. AG-I]|nr:hypothetical protein BDV93DRAFT_512432 [Ceratobasidium sp. AG-I]
MAVPIRSSQIRSRQSDKYCGMIKRVEKKVFVMPRLEVNWIDFVTGVGAAKKDLVYRSSLEYNYDNLSWQVQPRGLRIAFVPKQRARELWYIPRSCPTGIRGGSVPTITDKTDAVIIFYFFVHRLFAPPKDVSQRTLSHLFAEVKPKAEGADPGVVGCLFEHHDDRQHRIGMCENDITKTLHQHCGEQSWIALARQFF